MIRFHVINVVCIAGIALALWPLSLFLYTSVFILIGAFVYNIVSNFPGGDA
ncbi:MAG TPA: hypothetical protein VK530_21040 [Candidatus Acidoferrum sp.]|nr:hypothetical protein [Candidatus Acidoferrum sp.]